MAKLFRRASCTWKHNAPVATSSTSRSLGSGGRWAHGPLRPEDMTTSRRAYKIDEEDPGSDVAGETAAAMAAASIVFRKLLPPSSASCTTGKLFEFGDKYRGKYEEFSWDVKYAGLQIIASMLPTEDKREERKEILQKYRSKAEHYICACLNKNNLTNVQRTPGGLLYVRDWNNMQYVSTAAFLLMIYSDHLQANNRMVNCHGASVGADEILSFVKSQADYILGSNPMAMSYLVGYGASYPRRVHHRGASIDSYMNNKGFIGCTQGYDNWYGRRDSNPNVLVGALVGGPDSKDQ